MSFSPKHTTQDFTQKFFKIWQPTVSYFKHELNLENTT